MKHLIPPPAIRHNAATVRLLRDTLRRAYPDAIPSSFQRQLLALVKYGLRQQLGGRKPVTISMKVLAEWGECSDRQARSNMATLRSWGAVTPVAFEKGGLQATSYAFDGENLFRALVACGCNPGPALREGLAVFTDPCPRKSPPEVPPEVRHSSPPEVDDNFVVENHGDKPVFCTFGAISPDTPEVDGCFSIKNQCDSLNQLPGSGNISYYREPSRGRISSSETFPPVLDHGGPAHDEVADDPHGVNPSDLDDDQHAYLNVIRRTGGATYGHVATVSGMGGTRAFLAEEDLLRRGLITRVQFGKTVIR